MKTQYALLFLATTNVLNEVLRKIVAQGMLQYQSSNISTYTRQMMTKSKHHKCVFTISKRILTVLFFLFHAQIMCTLLTHFRFSLLCSIDYRSLVTSKIHLLVFSILLYIFFLLIHYIFVFFVLFCLVRVIRYKKKIYNECNFHV